MIAYQPAMRFTLFHVAHEFHGERFLVTLKQKRPEANDTFYKIDSDLIVERKAVHKANASL